MSVPYGPPQGFPPGPPGPVPQAGPGPDLGKILALVAGGLALVFFFFTFSDDVRGFAGGVSDLLVFGGGLLAAATALPNAPKTLVPATVITAVGTLNLLVNVVKGPLGADADTPGLVIVALIISFLVLIATVVALLFETGMMTGQPAPVPFSPQAGFPGQQPVGPPSGGFPAQQPQPGYQQPASGGFPQQPGVPAHNPTQVTPGYGQPPGQYGPPPGF